MSAAAEIEQGEDPGIAPRAAITNPARADRDNAAGLQFVGRPVAVPGPALAIPREELIRRLLARCEPTGDCLLWTGAKTQGYGSIRLEGRSHRTHVLAYELVVGPVPVGKVLDHTCHNLDLTCPGGDACLHRACFYVDHLEPVTRGENIARSPLTVSIADYHRALTHCPSGHPYDEANTHIKKSGARACRACARERGRRNYVPRRAS